MGFLRIAVALIAVVYLAVNTYDYIIFFFKNGD